MRGTIWEIIKFVIIALLIILPIRFWIAQPFIVSGASMHPTFENADYLIIDEFSYHLQDPQRGEVIVFIAPRSNGKFFIKRIIGLPGETIEIKQGRVFIFSDSHPDGTQIEESYLSGDVLTSPGAQLRTTLEEEEFFVLGDNRSHSSDSRSWGPVGENLIVGRALIRLWPISDIGFWPGS